MIICHRTEGTAHKNVGTKYKIKEYPIKVVD
jgi:hypothetical protein